MSSDNLKALIDEELAKFENKSENNGEINSETSRDEDSSEITSEPVEPSETSNKDEDPYLKEALDMGYNPNYKGSNRKTPEQFVRDGSFFKKIDELKKENKDIKDLLKQQMEHARKVEKAAHEKALESIKQEKLEMINQADVEGYKIAEQKEQALQQQLKEVQPQAPQQVEVSPEVAEFTERNKFWLNQETQENKEMVEDALLIDQTLAKRAAEKGLTLNTKEHLKLVEERIKQLYPHKFENPKTNKPATVATSTASENTKSSLVSKLSKQQRDFLKAAQMYDKSFTAEEYAKQLKLTGDLRDE